MRGPALAEPVGGGRRVRRAAAACLQRAPRARRAHRRSRARRRSGVRFCWFCVLRGFCHGLRATGHVVFYVG